MAWISLSGTLEDKKTGDAIAYSAPDSKLRKVTVPEGIEEEQTFGAVVFPWASMEGKAGIPESREAWSDHRLHTERVHTDSGTTPSSLHPDTEISSRT